MNGPGCTSMATVVGSGVPEAPVLASSSSLMQPRFTSPTFSARGRSASTEPGSASCARASAKNSSTVASR